MTELRETTELMESGSHRDRFKAEYYQLNIRIDRLAEMLNKYRAGVLEFEPICPYELLRDQIEVMIKYREILRERALIEHIDL